MRPLKLTFLAAVAVIMIVFALANREPVVVRVVPAEIAGFFPSLPAFAVPSFALIFAGILIGLMIGFVWEWMREHRYRAEAVQNKREVSKLAMENEDLKKRSSKENDEILALLE